MRVGYLSRKEEIVLTTISLIHELGVNNVSMKEIGKREGITEAALYKHFKNKEELLAAVMEYYEQYDGLIYRTLSNNEESAVDNIRSFFSIYTEYYNNYKEITALSSAYGVLAYDKNLSERVKALLKRKMAFLTELVERGQKNHELKDRLQAESLAYILYGSFEKAIDMWRLDGYQFSLREREEEMIGAILAAFRTEAGSS